MKFTKAEIKQIQEDWKWTRYKFSEYNFLPDPVENAKYRYNRIKEYDEIMSSIIEKMKYHENKS